MITVRCFAGLREQMGWEIRQIPAGPDSVCAVWEIVTNGAPMPTHLLAAINLDYADLDAPVTDGDEVAFFPPVTGGAS